MRRDREDELDLAEVGGEANTATLARKIAYLPNAPNGWTGRGEAGILR
jgi:hypothetical protein